MRPYNDALPTACVVSRPIWSSYKTNTSFITIWEKVAVLQSVVTQRCEKVTEILCPDRIPKWELASDSKIISIFLSIYALAFCMAFSMGLATNNVHR